MSTVEKPSEISFRVAEYGDSVHIVWRKWFAVSAITIGLIIFNVAMVAAASQDGRIPMRYLNYPIAISALLILLTWMNSGYVLRLTTIHLFYKGGWFNWFGRSIVHQDIQVIQLESAIDYSDGDGDADEYFLVIKSVKNDRFEIGGRMDKADAEFLKSQIEKYNANKGLSRTQGTAEPFQFILKNPLLFNLLVADAIAALLWGNNTTEDGTKIPSSFGMIIGWAIYGLLVWLFIYRNGKGTDKRASRTNVLMYTCISLAIATALFYWIFFL